PPPGPPGSRPRNPARRRLPRWRPRPAAATGQTGSDVATSWRLPNPALTPAPAFPGTLPEHLTKVGLAGRHRRSERHRTVTSGDAPFTFGLSTVDLAGRPSAILPN